MTHATVQVLTRLSTVNYTLRLMVTDGKVCKQLQAGK
jgi:hypothetical protein